MEDRSSLGFWLRLTLIPGIGGETQRKLLTAFGLPDAIFSAGYSALRSVIGDKLTQSLLDTYNQDAIDAALEWSSAPDCHLLTLADPHYPQALLEIPDPPTLLYVRGRVGLLNRPSIAVVGSRNPTPQGIQNAEAFSSLFAKAGLVVTSGLALGIDAAAHRGCLKANGDTVAFIGTGIDRIYPARNKELALEIGSCGTIVSEFPLATPVIASNFPRRNRLISGISRGVLVVEASVDSGSLITARLAAEQSRDVFAIPGSIHSPQSRGCHKLIKEGAKLVETASDVLDDLRWSYPAAPADTPVSEFRVDDAQSFLLNAMGFDPCSSDELIVRCGLSPELLSAQLLSLELEGKIAVLPGGRFQRVSLI